VAYYFLRKGNGKINNYLSEKWVAHGTFNHQLLKAIRRVTWWWLNTDRAEYYSGKRWKKFLLIYTLARWVLGNFIVIDEANDLVSVNDGWTTEGMGEFMKSGEPSPNKIRKFCREVQTWLYRL